MIVSNRESYILQYDFIIVLAFDLQSDLNSGVSIVARCSQCPAFSPYKCDHPKMTKLILQAYLSWSFDRPGVSSLIFVPSLVTTNVTTGLFYSFGKYIVNFALVTLA